MAQILQQTARRMAELLAFIDDRMHGGVVYLDALYGEDDELNWSVRDEVSTLVNQTRGAP